MRDDDGSPRAESRSGTLEVSLALPLRAGRILVARRSPGAHQAGVWEFPGGKIAEGEQPVEAARRELAEETGLVAGEMEPLVVVVHEYPEHPVRLHCFIARDPRGEVRLDPPREWSWRAPAEMLELEMPPANAPILRALRWRLP